MLIIYIFFLESSSRDLSIPGPYFFQGPLCDFTQFFEISPVLKIDGPVLGIETLTLVEYASFSADCTVWTFVY